MRVGAILGLAVWAAFSQDAPTFRTGVALVQVEAEVTAADGRLLTGFTKDDFRILDEGVEQPIAQFSWDEEPLDLILLFDISGSMRPKVQQVASAARQGVQELRAGDRVAVMVFNTHSRMVTDFTEDLDAVQRTIQEDVLALKFGGGTYIQNAVDDAALRLAKQPRTRRRRAVLIVTDDFGQRTRRESSVVRDFWEADALLTGLIVRSAAAHTLHTFNTVTHPYLVSLEVGIKGVAEKTGGDFIQASDAGSAFQESMRRIRRRYSLYYVQPEGNPGSTRTVRVELQGGAAKQNPKARVRARTGYTVPGK
jgi:VWFA-related protein